MKVVTKKTRFAEIAERAQIVWRHPDEFEFDRFEIEEVAILHGSVLQPNLIPVVYILWGVLPKGNRAKSLQFVKHETVDEYERRNGHVPEGYNRL